MTAQAAGTHALLILAALRTEAIKDRLDDESFRKYVVSLTESLDLPTRNLTVLPGGDAA